MKAQGKLAERFPKDAWHEHVEFLSKMAWKTVIVKSTTEEEGAVVWDIPDMCQQWVGKKGKWMTSCMDYEKKLRKFLDGASSDSDDNEYASLY